MCEWNVRVDVKKSGGNKIRQINKSCW
jgi:hypothetical protein